MTADRAARRRDLTAAFGYDRVSMFVPAVMSVGLVFWIVNELRDLARDRRRHERDRRARIVAAAVVDRTIGRREPRAPEELGLRPRPVYLLLTAALWLGAVYVAVGSLGNYGRRGGYVAHIAWLLALSLAVSLVGALYGAAALATFLRHPALPLGARPLVVGTPLTTSPVPRGALAGRAPWPLTAALTAAAAASALLALVVAWAPHVVRHVDVSTAAWVREHPPAEALTWFDPLGATEVALALTAIGVLASFRCRALASSFVLAVGAGLVVSLTVRPLVAHPRPATGSSAGGLDAFPSGHVLLGVILAGVLPLALRVALDRPGAVAALRLAFGAGVAGAAAHRVAIGAHWPTDVLGGALVGLALVLAVERVLATERSHARCHGCPWRPGEEPRVRRGVVALRVDTVRAVRLAAHLSAAAAASGLAILAFAADVPTNPDGPAFGPAIERPVQLALAGLLSIGALVAWRWPAPGSLLMALAATGLGVFASVEYRPGYGVALTGALLTPAVLTWLAWQHRRRHGEILALAVVTAVLLASTWAGAERVYAHFYGPTHPGSAAPELPVDRVEWVWLGALSADGLTVSVRLADGRRRAVVVATPAAGGAAVRSPMVAAGEHRIASIRLGGLASDAAYTYLVEVDGVADRSRGAGRFRTPGAGATSFRFAVASCARTGSNGAVYDAIVATEPLLYLELGDLHYENLTATGPGPFLDAYDRVLGTPAQGALARTVPMAYVWDDHDYGPNDAGADSPTRPAVRAAYDLAFPHYPLAADTGPIAQAFTIGRVRFVMTDGRSGRTAATLLGATQEAWLVDEVARSSRTHALVVWVNATPWIGTATAGSDTWAGYDDERTRIADGFAAARVTNLVMVAGDAHMVAIDDGTNTGYATAGGTGFPLLQASPLDRPPSVKGGPYSEGTFAGPGQFGLVDVVDDGGPTVTVRLSGRTWDGRELVAHERTFDAGPDALT